MPERQSFGSRMNICTRRDLDEGYKRQADQSNGTQVGADAHACIQKKVFISVQFLGVLSASFISCENNNSIVLHTPQIVIRSAYPSQMWDMTG